MEARLAQIENTTLSNYLRYKPADKRVDEKQGRKDGEQDRPEASATIYPFRARLVTEAQAALRAYHDKVEDLVADLVRRQGSLQRDIDERYSKQRDELNSAYKDSLDHVEHKWGPSSAKHSNLRDRHTRFSDREKHIEAELGRPLRIHLLHWYLLIMLSVAFIEIPINRFAFELYFAETPALSILIALGIGLSLMLLTHLGGTWLKRSTGKIRRIQKIRYLVGVFAAAALTLPTIFLIALLRQHYVHFIENQQISFAELLQQEGLGSVARDVISTSLGTQGWMLFMINILVVGIGTLVAIVRHDSHPDYEKVVRTREKLERRLTKLKTKSEAASAKIKREYEDRLAGLEKQYERIEREIEETKTQQKKCLDHKDRMLERVALHIKQRLQAYEAGNDSARKSASPAMFWKSDEAEIKEQLERSFEASPEYAGKSASSIHAVS